MQSKEEIIRWRRKKRERDSKERVNARRRGLKERGERQRESTGQGLEGEDIRDCCKLSLSEPCWWSEMPYL